MPESYAAETHAVLSSLKNNRSGTLRLKNGQVAVRTPTTGNTYYTTIIGAQYTADNEAVRGDEYEKLNYAESHPNATGDLTVQNGYLQVTGYTGTVTLVDG